MAPKKTKEINFENSLKELEKIVSTMEAGGLTLEESLKNFEKGVGLVAECQNSLKEAEQKVKILTAKGELENYLCEEDEDNDEV